MERGTAIIGEEKQDIQTINYERQDWRLLDVDGAEDIARFLTNKFNKMAQSGMEAEDVFKGMMRYMKNFDEFGASDTEGRYALLGAIEEVFGDGSTDKFPY